MKKIEVGTYSVIIAFLCNFFAIFLSNGIIVGVPAIAADFHMSNFIQNWIPTIMFLVMAIFTVPAGQIAGKYGVKKTLMMGIIVYLISSIGACLSLSSDIFMVFRMIQGAGVAFITVAGMAMVVSSNNPQNRGKSLGIAVTGVYLATSFAPVICGFLTYNFGWRYLFYLVIPFLILCLALIYFKIPQEWKTYEGDSIDTVGSIIWAIGILLFIYGFTNLTNILGIILTIIGLIIVVIFVIYENKQKTPVFAMNLFKNKKFLSSNIAALCSYLAIMVVTTILNYHFQYVRGWNSQTTGLILIVTPIIMAIIAPTAGKLSDKYHPQKLASIGMGIAAISLGILTTLNPNTPLYIIFIAMIFQGVGMGLFSSPNTNAIMSSVPLKYAPTASASQSTVRTIGQTMSLGMLTLVFSWELGDLAMNTNVAMQIIQGSQHICLICCCLCVLAVFASLIGIKSKDKFNTE